MRMTTVFTAAAAFVLLTASAHAGETMTLSDAQLDGISAGTHYGPPGGTQLPPLPDWRRYLPPNGTWVPDLDDYSPPGGSWVLPHYGPPSGSWVGDYGPPTP